ncbi:MAG: hypothetical protein FWH22_11205, partial [Fibromonadales bacterium]|nr:hypothetical protein [Fibromonadales bacterium]
MNTVYIWGAGHYGVLTALELERKGAKITGFIDSNKELWGKKRLGVKIFSPEILNTLQGRGNSTKIIIAVIGYEQAISKYLKEIGLFKGQNFEISEIIGKPFYPIELNAKEKKLADYLLKENLTMTSRGRIYATILSCKYAVEQNIKGDFVECGVWRDGNSIAAAAI